MKIFAISPGQECPLIIRVVSPTSKSPIPHHFFTFVSVIVATKIHINFRQCQRILWVGDRLSFATNKTLSPPRKECPFRNQGCSE